MNRAVSTDSVTDEGAERLPDDSWREIADAAGKDEAFCRKLWKNLGECFFF